MTYIYVISDQSGITRKGDERFRCLSADLCLIQFNPFGVDVMAKLLLVAIGTIFALVCVFGDSHRAAKSDLNKLNGALVARR